MLFWTIVGALLFFFWGIPFILFLITGAGKVSYHIWDSFSGLFKGFILYCLFLIIYQFDKTPTTTFFAWVLSLMMIFCVIGAGLEKRKKSKTQPVEGKILPSDRK
jgi:hypothetical protein